MSNLTKQVINVHVLGGGQAPPSVPNAPNTGFIGGLADFAQTNFLTIILLTLGITAIILAIIFFIKHKKKGSGNKLSPSFKTSKFSFKNKFSDRISKPKTKFAAIFASFTTAIFAAIFMSTFLANAATPPHTDIASSGSDVNITLVKGESGTKTTVAKSPVNITSNINTELTAKLSLDTTETSPEIIANFTANTGSVSAPAQQTANTLGFAIPNKEQYLVANGFAPSYFQTENSATIPSETFAGINVNGAQTPFKIIPVDTITNGTDSNIATDLFFAITANDSLPAGDYKAVVNIEVTDTSPATVKASYNTTSSTNQDVIATLTSSEPLQTPAGWTEVSGSDGTQFTKTFSDNITENITVKDLGGNETGVQIDITNIDKTPPVITINGAISLNHEAKTPYTDLGADAIDAVDGAVSVSTSGAVNDQVKGQYTIAYTATDAAGNQATATRTVNVVDTTAPVLTVSPSRLDIVQGTTIADLNAYILNGVSATDSYDDTITLTSANYSVSPSLNTNVLGDYTITYNVSDASGNAATPETRVIHVVDVNAPTATVSYSPAGPNPTNQNVTATMTTSELINTPTGWTKVDDTHYTKVYTANATETLTISDPSGNTSNVSILVDWIDKGAPTATVSYSPSTLTNKDVVATLTTSEPVGAISGWSQVDSTDYQKTYTANTSGDTTINFTDLAGNPGSTTVNISWIDKTVPVITVGSTTTSYVENSTVNILDNVTASDNHDGDITSNITTTCTNTASGATYNCANIGTEVGTFRVTYPVSDAAGNQATTKTRNYTITAAPAFFRLQAQEAGTMTVRDKWSTAVLVKNETQGTAAVSTTSTANISVQVGDIVRVTESSANTTFRSWSSTNNPLAKGVKTAVISMPEMNRFTTNSTGTTAGDRFFVYFNYSGTITTLPVGSFDTSNITTVGGNFFAYFNFSGSLTSLPAGSFDTSKITTAGTNFFNGFNYNNGKLIQGNNSISIKNITSSAITFHYWTGTATASKSVPAGGSMTYNGM